GIALSHIHASHLAVEDSSPLFVVRKCRREHVHFSCSRLKISSRTIAATPQNSSWRCSFSGLAPDAIQFEEVFHRCRNFDGVCLNSEMTCLEESHFCIWQVLSKRLGSCRNEKRIILAPDCQ